MGFIRAPGRLCLPIIRHLCLDIPILTEVLIPLTALKNVNFEETPQQRRNRARRIARRLEKLYPNPKSALNWADPFQLLVATILSAQCTDVAVNKATPGLFGAFPTPTTMAAAELPAIEKQIRSLGLYRNKARHIQACARALLEEHRGCVPEAMEDLTKLPGVGRKTAHCVRAWVFGLPGLTVDTHVQRLTKRWALHEEKDPVKIEKVLAELLPASRWSAFSHGTILHGRQVCPARKPRCGECPLLPDCPHGQANEA